MFACYYGLLCYSLLCRLSPLLQLPCCIEGHAGCRGAAVLLQAHSPQPNPERAGG